MTDWTKPQSYSSYTTHKITVVSPFHDAWDKLAKRLELERSRAKSGG